MRPAEAPVGVLLRLGPTALHEQQPGPNAALPHGADGDVAFLAHPQRVGNHVLGLGEAALLDVEMGEVAHRGGGEIVEPLLQAHVLDGEQVGPPAQVARAQLGDRDADQRGGV